MNLTYLNIFGENIKDTSALENLKNLTELDIGGSNFEETPTLIFTLKKLNNLTHLIFSDNKKMSAIPPLNMLVQVTHLSFEGCTYLQDISAVLELGNLTKLEFNYCFDIFNEEKNYYKQVFKVFKELKKRKKLKSLIWDGEPYDFSPV